MEIHLIDRYFCTVLDVSFAVSQYTHLEAKFQKCIAPGHAAYC